MVVIRNTVWLSVCRIAADLSGLVLFTVISRRYGPMGTGEYSYAFALGAFIAILATSGIEQYGVRQYACLKSAQQKTDCWQSLLVTQTIQLSLGLLVLGAVMLVVGTQRASPIVILELCCVPGGVGPVAHAVCAGIGCSGHGRAGLHRARLPARRHSRPRWRCACSNPFPWL